MESNNIVGVSNMFCFSVHNRLYTSVSYVYISINIFFFLQFQTVPSEIFDLSLLSVLLMRNNPLNELPADVSRLCNLTTCVLSFGMLTSLPTELVLLRLAFILTYSVHCRQIASSLTINTPAGSLLY
jgi:Leucine-rich repeat (LRR) protein